MKVDFEKVGVIASHFAENISELYVTKLLKLFYYFDFISYKIRGSSVTNDTYYKLPYGPVPSAIKSEIDTLSSDNIVGGNYKSQFTKFIKLEIDGKNNGKIVKNKFKNYNLNKLSDFEMDLIKNLIEVFKNTGTKIISNQTHKEKPWHLTSDNSVIDYELSNQLDIKKILPKFIAK
jgi:uncharacterized phage-associated protein